MASPTKTRHRNSGHTPSTLENLAAALNRIGLAEMTEPITDALDKIDDYSNVVDVRVEFVAAKARLVDAVIAGDTKLFDAAASLAAGIDDFARAAKDLHASIRSEIVHRAGDAIYEHRTAIQDRVNNLAAEALEAVRSTDLKGVANDSQAAAVASKPWATIIANRSTLNVTQAAFKSAQELNLDISWEPSVAPYIEALAADDRNRGPGNVVTPVELQSLVRRVDDELAQDADQ